MVAGGTSDRLKPEHVEFDQGVVVCEQKHLRGKQLRDGKNKSNVVSDRVSVRVRVSIRVSVRVK